MEFRLIGDFLIYLSAIIAIVRAFKVDNYLRLCDHNETVTFYQHLSKFISSQREMKKYMGLWIPILITSKTEFECKRKTINNYTFMLYLFLTVGVLIIVLSGG